MSGTPDPKEQARRHMLVLYVATAVMVLAPLIVLWFVSRSRP
jgi:hypothetical protein